MRVTSIFALFVPLPSEGTRSSWETGSRLSAEEHDSNLLIASLRSARLEPGLARSSLRQALRRTLRRTLQVRLCATSRR